MRIEWNTWCGTATAMAYDYSNQYGEAWKLVMPDGHEEYFPKLPNGYRVV